MREQEVVRINLRRLHRHFTRHLVSARGDEVTNHFFRRPALLDELCGEKIQQLRMRRFLAQPSKVVHRGHQSAPEQVLPHAIDQHARREWVRCVRDVVRQFEPPAEFRFVAARGKELQVTARLRSQRFQVIATRQQRRVVAHGFQHARSAARRGNVRFEIAIFRDKRCYLRQLLHRHRQQPTAQECVEKHALLLAHEITAPRGDGSRELIAEPLGQSLR